MSACTAAQPLDPEASVKKKRRVLGRLARGAGVGVGLLFYLKEDCVLHGGGQSCNTGMNNQP